MFSCFVTPETFLKLFMHVALQKVHEAMNKPGVSAKLKDVLSQVSTYDNVPRKKAKFQVSTTGVGFETFVATLCAKFVKTF